jgi:hypothetical protein
MHVTMRLVARQSEEPSAQHSQAHALTLIQCTMSVCGVEITGSQKHDDKGTLNRSFSSIILYLHPHSYDAAQRVVRCLEGGCRQHTQRTWTDMVRGGAHH